MRVHRWILLLTIVYLHAVQAAPLPSLLSAVTNTVGVFARDGSDVSSGSDRTLYSIIRSCLLTIAACVYRAIHPNIPSPTASTWRTFRERLIIMAYMLLVPELVIYWAAEQWSSARYIANEVNTEVGKVTKAATCPYNHLECPLCDPKKFKWSTAHGHYLQMGGYIREDNEEVLTYDVLIVLVRKRQISVHDLNRCTEKRIKDRSKGDILSKAILTLQTSWFIIQCIARLAQRLDLAELEVVTFAFCVLNVATFLLWWSKPLDVHSPTFLRIYSTHTQFSSSGTNTTDTPPVSPQSPRDSKILSSPTTSEPLEEKVAIDSPSPASQSTPPHFSPWSLFTWISHLFSRFFTHLGELTGFRKSAYELPPHATSVGRFYREKPDDIIYLFVGNMVLGVVFGAIHFMSWSFSFPTKHEQALWRVFTIVATVFPLAFVVLGLLSFKVLRRLPPNKLLSNIVEAFVGIVFVLAILFYVVARLGLFIQALVSLRKLPASVFDNVVWSSFFPHF